jgi:hypothetical protein
MEPFAMSTSRRSYRCTYHPTDSAGFASISDTGVLPFVQLRASDAEEAQRLAHHITGCAVSEVQRLDQTSARCA